MMTSGLNESMILSTFRYACHHQGRTVKSHRTAVRAYMTFPRAYTSGRCSTSSTGTFRFLTILTAALLVQTRTSWPRPRRYA